jgi:two-component system sensor histidine kinase HydH
LRGALLTSFSITIFYLIFILVFWQGLSAEKYNTFIEIIFLNVTALMLGILREREKRERRRTQKIENLAAIGKTVSGIAHDMKTPLVAIAGFSRQILKKPGEGEPQREKLMIIHQEAQRLENMVKDMLEYARPLNLQLSPEDVNQIILESVVIVRDIAEAQQVTIESRLSPDSGLVELDAMRMKQVFINLLTNAIQASPAGETVYVASMNQNGKIIIEVTDHGSGLTADQKEHIFTPFFTTKKEGIGLGLVLVKNIVSAHGGQVEFFDNPTPQAGVTFRVVLPREAEDKSSQMQER